MTSEPTVTDQPLSAANVEGTPRRLFNMVRNAVIGTPTRQGN